MHQRLGVSFREVNENGQADIAGVPDELLTLWSKRTANIDAEAGPKIAEYEKLLGRTLSSSERVGVVKTAVLKTRARKQHPELSALHATWTAEAARLGWTPEGLRRAVRLRTPPARVRQGSRVLPSDPAEPTGLARPAAAVRPGADRSSLHRPAVVLPAYDAVLPAATGADPGPVADAGVAAAALQGAGTRRAVFSRADVAGQVAAHLPTTGLSAAEVVKQVEQLTEIALGLEDAVAIGPQGVGGTPRASDARYATVQVLTAEARILDLARRGRPGSYGRLPHSALMPMGRDGGLDPSQYRAVLHLAVRGLPVGPDRAGRGGQDQHAGRRRPRLARRRVPGGRVGAVGPRRRRARHRHRRPHRHLGQMAAHPPQHPSRRAGGDVAG
jgi:hypothetical protein